MDQEKRTISAMTAAAPDVWAVVEEVLHGDTSPTRDRYPVLGWVTVSEESGGHPVSWIGAVIYVESTEGAVLLDDFVRQNHPDAKAALIGLVRKRADGSWEPYQQTPAGTDGPPAHDAQRPLSADDGPGCYVGVVRCARCGATTVDQNDYNETTGAITLRCYACNHSVSVVGFCIAQTRVHIASIKDICLAVKQDRGVFPAIPPDDQVRRVLRDCGYPSEGPITRRTFER